MTADPHPAERQRLRAAALRLIESLVTRDATAEQLTGWAETVEAFARQIEDDPPGSVYWGIGSRGTFAAKGLLAPPAFVPPAAQPGDTSTGTVTFGEDQAGHRGLAHGGSIAQAFDYVLGAANAFEGVTFTRELSVRFHRPVPLHQQVTFETRVRSRDGTSVEVEGRALCGDTVHADAQAVLVVKAPR